MLMVHSTHDHPHMRRHRGNVVTRRRCCFSPTSVVATQAGSAATKWGELKVYQNVASSHTLGVSWRAVVTQLRPDAYE